MLPLYYETEQEVFDAALGVIGLTEPADSRVMWIRDTLHLAEVECSAAYWSEAQQRDDLTVLSDPRDLTFEAGLLAPPNGVLAHS
jgi:hypothetical protein